MFKVQSSRFKMFCPTLNFEPRSLNYLLACEKDDKGDHQSVNRHGFGQAQAQDHDLANIAHGVRVAAHRLRRPKGAYTEADAGAYAPETDRHARRYQLARVFCK